MCAALEWLVGRDASLGQNMCASRAGMCPLLSAVLRPADRQACGQGAALLPAEYSTQGGEPGAQETESRIPGLICTTASNCRMFVSSFSLEAEVCIHCFLNCYEFKATFVHVKLKSCFLVSCVAWLDFFSCTPGCHPWLRGESDPHLGNDS